MNEDLTSLVSVAIVGAVLVGFAAGSRVRKSKPRNSGGHLPRRDSLMEPQKGQSPEIAMEDKRCFFIFTSLVLDLLPVYLRLYFRVRWFETRGRIWRDRPSDGEAFWHGTYELTPFAMVRVSEGSTVSAVIHTNNTPPQTNDLKPGERVKIGREPTKVVCTRGCKVHLSSPSTATGDLPLFRQHLPGEANADSRMSPFYAPKVLRGDVRGWDVSLLCFALLNSSHHLMGTAPREAKSMVEALRDLRNDKLAHVERCAMSIYDLREALNTMDSFMSVCLSEHWESWVEASRGLMEEARDAYTGEHTSREYNTEGGVASRGFHDADLCMAGGGRQGEIHICIEQSDEGYETDESDKDIERSAPLDATLAATASYSCRGGEASRSTLDAMSNRWSGQGLPGHRDQGDRILLDRWASEFTAMSLTNQLSDIYGRFSCAAVKFTNAWVDIVDMKPA